MHQRWHGFVIGIFFSALFAAGTHFYLTARHGRVFQTLQTFDDRFNDIKFKFLSLEKTNSTAVLVAVDDESIREIGRWPWPRDVMAQLQEELVKHNVSAIGMDIIQSEPDLFFPEKDKALALSTEKISDKMILGTFSNNQLQILPYQDYCVNEAFLVNGGSELIKINPTFVVDDVGADYDEIPWAKPLKMSFDFIKKRTEVAFLQSKVKFSVDELTAYQKNFLTAQKTSEIFNYCKRWLTSEDEIFKEHGPTLLPVYEDILKIKFPDPKLSTLEKLENFKNSVDSLPLPQYGDWQGNFPELQEKALNTGSFVTQLDNDGLVRRYPMFYRAGNKLGTSFVPSLALQTYLVAKGYRADVKIDKVNGIKQIVSFSIIDPSKDPEVKIQDIPVDASGQLIVKYYGPTNTLPYVSAKDLLATDDEFIYVYTRAEDNEHGQMRIEAKKHKKSDFFKGKSVITGVTSLALYDLRNTPVDKNYPGPEIHLTVLNNLLKGDFVKPLGHAHWIIPGVIIALGLLMSLILTFIGALPALGSMVIFSLGFVYIDGMVFHKLHLSYSSLAILIEIIGLHFTTFIFKYFSEERKKIALKKTFSKYVSPAVVDELLRSDENLKIGGKKQVLSVFFSDLRGFTDLSEKMDPGQLAQFLNEYLTPMTRVIFDNKGTLDKYMGDGVMAFFGAPVTDKDHAINACRCALQSLEELEILRTEFARRGWPLIDLGIGINTGPMSVGNMGSASIQSYTVIGDSVNLGARLEAANKEFGTRILVSESTFEQAQNYFCFREVGRIAVKGKIQPIRTYELISEKVKPEIHQWLDLYHQAYHLYMNQNFAKALEIFEQAEHLKSQDKVTSIYKQRCLEYIQNPPPADWDGVDRLKTK
ncbi:MAG: adenylate/guanylate cyclase domain-containing protein [Bdellovibrionales bacterium]|nr:adenylate/guanylate cyclase domain-containing protein [Bdellovibrionales bacterium]